MSFKNEINFKNFDDLGDCIRKNSMFKLPEKCFNQIETCFRYFNLNGPLKLGQANNNKKNEENNQFEGCISDVYLNDKLIDLNPNENKLENSIADLDNKKIPILNHNKLSFVLF